MLGSVLLVISIVNHVSRGGNIVDYETYFEGEINMKAIEICDEDDLNDYNHVINIDPTKFGNSNCTPKLFASQRHMTCPDVNTALKFHADSTAYVFASGANITHYLKSDLNNSITSFKSQSKVGFFSSNDSELASIECLDNAGLAFTNVNSVRIHRVVFSYCGICRNTTSKEYTKKDKLYLIQVKASLYFYNGSDVTMCHVIVQHSPDAVGVVMYDVDGTVNVYNSTFYNNTCSRQSSPGGGGVVIEFSSCIPGNRECVEQTSHNTNARYTFYHTLFVSNSAKILTSPNKKTRDGFGIGGGMAVLFRGNAKGNSFEIQSCDFIGNEALSGGGLFIEFGDTSIENSVDITSTFVAWNTCPATAGVGGGGVRVTSILDDDFTKSMFDPSIKGNRVNISGKFINNKAQKGGAISFSPAFQTRFVKHQTTTLNIVNSHFSLNRALVGAAVHLEVHPLFVWGIVNFVTIESSSFRFNSIGYASNPSNYGAGIGVLYASQVPVRFQSNVHFENNYGTALVLTSTYATIYDSTLNFTNNRGDTGGGIAFLGNSHAIVSNTTNMHFERNFAHKGGAIYNFIVTQGDRVVTGSCFIQNQDPLVDIRQWGAKFTFINNTSTDLRSNSIFSTSVYPCTYYGPIEEGEQLSDALLFCINKHWIFHDTNCENETRTEGNSYTFLNKSAITAYPGQGFELPIEVRDDLGHTITDSVGYTSTVPTVNNSQLAQVDPRFKFVSENFIVITGQENTTVNLELQSSGSRPHYLQIEVNLLECPPGFHFTVTFKLGTLILTVITSTVGSVCASHIATTTR